MSESVRLQVALEKARREADAAKDRETDLAAQLLKAELAEWMADNANAEAVECEIEWQYEKGDFFESVALTVDGYWCDISAWDAASARVAFGMDDTDENGKLTREQLVVATQ
jgi:hypothetical protein